MHNDKDGSFGMLNLISGINLETYVKDLKTRLGSQGKIK